MKKYFISGDIHSFGGLWRMSLEAKGFDVENPEHIIIICGDLYDRGDDSIICYDFVSDMLKQDRCIYVKGNHEDLIQQCLFEIRVGSHIGHHHWTNGTIKTIAHFLECSPYDIMNGSFDSRQFDKVYKLINDFINDNCVDYYELGEYVFVHGWIPVQDTSNSNAWKIGDWNEARWLCPFDQYISGSYLDNRTIVCGHWHTSYAFHRDDPNVPEWGPLAKFNIYKKPGIIALDGCVVYSHKINILVLEESENGITEVKE